MTNREFFEAIVAGSVITPELEEKAKEAIAKLDATNERRKIKAAEKANVNDAFVTKMVSLMSDKPMTASDILEVLKTNGVERGEEKSLNVQFVSSMARKGVAQGLLVQSEVKVPKKGVQKAYTVA